MWTTTLPNLTVRTVTTLRAKSLAYRFTFNRLSNELSMMFDETVAPKEVHVHLIRFACQRVTP